MNDTLFLDKREASQLEYLTVNETAVDPPTPGEDPDNNINAPDRLSLEATMINQNFSQQILKSGNRKVMIKLSYVTMSTAAVEPWFLYYWAGVGSAIQGVF